MLKKDIPKAARRPLLTKNKPLKLVKATKKVTRKVVAMTTGISKTRISFVLKVMVDV